MDYQKSKYIDSFSEQVEALASYADDDQRADELDKFVRESIAACTRGDDVPRGAIVAMARALVKYVRDEWDKTQAKLQ